jgi:hypothetical protein
MRMGRRSSWTAVLLAAALLAAPVQAPAQESGSTVEGWSWSKFLDLAACGVGIATITTGGGLILAALACGRAADEWWTT